MKEMNTLCLILIAAIIVAVAFTFSKPLMKYLEVQTALAEKQLTSK